MFRIVTWTRALLAAAAISLFVPAAVANVADPLPSGTAPSRTETAKANDAAEEHQRNGSPELGILILIGAVAFIILVAWLIARVGDDSHRGGETSLN
jgi:hypothetical protein